MESFVYDMISVHSEKANVVLNKSLNDIKSNVTLNTESIVLSKTKVKN